MRIEPAASHRQGNELNLSILSRLLSKFPPSGTSNCNRVPLSAFSVRTPFDRPPSLILFLITVHSQIEAQCKTSTNKLKRTKSFTRSTSDSSRGPSRSDSPYGEAVQPKAKTRESSDADASSTNSGPNSGAPQASTAQPPAASEKSMTKKIFGRMSIDKESGGGHATEQGDKQQQHKRTASLMSGRRSSMADDPGSSPSEVHILSAWFFSSVVASSSLFLLPPSPTSYLLSHSSLFLCRLNLTS